jgi:hypothetical protein
MDEIMFMAFAIEADEIARLLHQLEVLDPYDETCWREQAKNASARELKDLIYEVENHLAESDFSV